MGCTAILTGRLGAQRYLLLTKHSVLLVEPDLYRMDYAVVHHAAAVLQVSPAPARWSTSSGRFRSQIHFGESVNQNLESVWNIGVVLGPFQSLAQSAGVRKLAVGCRSGEQKGSGYALYSH
jgi:hypothetical protein